MNRVCSILTTVCILALTGKAQRPATEGVREFKVAARKYEFSPATIAVKRGDRSVGFDGHGPGARIQAGRIPHRTKTAEGRGRHARIHS